MARTYSSIKDKVHIVMLKKNVIRQINIVIPLGATSGKKILKNIDESNIIIDINPKKINYNFIKKSIYLKIFKLIKIKIFIFYIF